VAERVSTGLLCTRIGLQPVGREMLATADRVAEQTGERRRPGNAVAARAGLAGRPADPLLRRRFRRARLG